jgi:hypothetical protein
MITHHPNSSGFEPEFISAIFVDSSNRVLAKVNANAEAERIAAQGLAEITRSTEIAPVEPQRKSRAKEDQA